MIHMSGFNDRQLPCFIIQIKCIVHGNPVSFRYIGDEDGIRAHPSGKDRQGSNQGMSVC